VTDLLDAEATRVTNLLAAQEKAAALFAAVEQQGVLAAGVRESVASKAIRAVAAEQFGVRRHWHKRIVRSGPNTLQPYRENPPDREIEADDIVFCDLGPIFEEWEADFARTFVLGDDPAKHRLRADLPEVFDIGRRFFDTNEHITGEELFDHVVGLAEARGWTWGGTIAGHLVGEFPHASATGHGRYSRIAPGNDRPMRGVDRLGRACHWILEIHLVDVDRQIGGFHEELLDLGH
jgi:Xaa-Pro aminopeptidase